MYIKLPSHIATKTYNVPSIPLSISYITDLKKDKEYILQDKVSNLWEYIVKTLDYGLVCKYAADNGLDCILDDLLYQLKSNNLIETDIVLHESNAEKMFKSISFSVKNIEFYSNAKTGFLRKNGFIEELVLVLTYKCKLNCKHCCSPKEKYDYQISYEQAKKIIDDAVETGVTIVTLTGGDCNLNKDFLKIAKYVRSKHLNLFVKTNGQELYDDANLLDELIKLYPYCVQLSVYSNNPEVHDNMTGVKGSFNKTMTVIKKLREHNISVEIANFISSYNKGRHKDLEEFAKNLKIGYSAPCSFINNPDNNNSDAALSLKDLEEYYSQIDNISETQRFKKNNEFLCTGGITKITISPDLNIIPCVYNKYIFGNYNTTTLQEVKEKVLPEYRKIFTANNLSECFKYDYCEYCKYCALQALLNEGFLKKSKILCDNAKAVQKAILKKQKEKV